MTAPTLHTPVPARRGAASTETIAIICCVALALLIATTALGRKVALLFRAGTRSLDDGQPRRAARTDISDLSGEFGPTFQDLQAGRGNAPARTGPLGVRVDSQADYYRNPATDPRSSQTLGQMIGGNPAANPNTVPLANFPATLVLPDAITNTTGTLLGQQHAQQLNVPVAAATEQGAIIVRQADGTLVARPGNNPGAPGGWNPNFQNAAPGETVVADIHIHPPQGQPGFLPHGFSDGDFSGGLMQQGPAAPATATQGAVNESLIIMRTGDDVYVAVRTANTTNLTSAQLQTIFWKAHNDALANGSSAAEAVFQANIAMAQAGGIALYRGRAGEPLRRVN